MHHAFDVVPDIARDLAHLPLAEYPKVDQRILLYVLEVDLYVGVTVPARVFVPHPQGVTKLVDGATYELVARDVH